MTATTTPIRVATKTAVVERLRARAGLQGVQIAYTWPGKDAKDELIFFAGTTGKLNVPTMKTGRRARIDEFTLTLHIGAGKKGQRTAEVADARAEALFAEIDDLMATDDFGDIDGLKWIYVDEVIFGPPDLGPEGYLVLVTVDLACHARLA